MGHPVATQAVQDIELIHELPVAAANSDDLATTAVGKTEDLQKETVVPYVIGEMTIINDSPLAQTIIFSPELHPMNARSFTYRVPL